MASSKMSTSYPARAVRARRSTQARRTARWPPLTHAVAGCVAAKDYEARKNEAIEARKRERELTLRDFIDGKIHVVVANDAFGMGIDHPCVRPTAPRPRRVRPVCAAVVEGPPQLLRRRDWQEPSARHRDRSAASLREPAQPLWPCGVRRHTT